MRPVRGLPWMRLLLGSVMAVLVVVAVAAAAERDGMPDATAAEFEAARARNAAMAMDGHYIKKPREAARPLHTLMRNNVLVQLGLGGLGIASNAEYLEVCCAPVWSPGLAAREEGGSSIDTDAWFAGCYPHGSDGTPYTLPKALTSLSECTRYAEHGRPTLFQQLVASWAHARVSLTVDRQRDTGGQARERCKHAMIE